MKEVSLKTQGLPRPEGQGMRGGRSAAQGVGRSRADEATRLAGACAEFEAIFVEQLFKTMRAGIPESGLMDGGRAEDIYTGMLDRQVALEMARGQGSIGLAQQMQARLAPDLPSDGGESGEAG